MYFVAREPLKSQKICQLIKILMIAGAAAPNDTDGTRAGLL